MRRIFNKIFKPEKHEQEMQEISIKDIIDKPLPKHIAIIMDGNGRWAKSRGLPRPAGHRAGMESFKSIVSECATIGINYLTVYAFSTENWKRPKEEVDALMNLLVEYIDKDLTELKENGVRVRQIGIRDGIPKIAQQRLEKAIKDTENNNVLNLQIALNYGGRREITDAVKLIAEDISKKRIEVHDINEELLSRYMYTNNIPDPDLMIRPSGEQRFSNFLIWQAAYAEFWLTEVLWPDFTKEELYKAIYSFQQRHRRFGGL